MKSLTHPRIPASPLRAPSGPGGLIKPAALAAGLLWLATGGVGAAQSAGGVAAQSGDDAWRRQPGGLLPLHDRVGNPQVAAVVEEALGQALAEGHELIDPIRLRDAQRRLRLRDTSQAGPATLARLGELTAAGWLFSATLHQASENRASRAARAYTGTTSAGGVPQIVLSGRVIRLNGDRERAAPEAREPAILGWAGFEAASGLDRRRLLGLGVVADPELLARDVARRLIEAFEQGRPDAAKEGARRPARGGYLRRPIDAGGTIAVVPFHSVTARDATVAGETVTDLALAVLHGNGAGHKWNIMLPGLVNEILRRRGTLLRGEVDAEVRAELREHGADLIMTGAVEAWEVRRGAEPEPRVGLSARLLDAESGAILWWNGQDRRGWDRSRALGLGRIHASGALAEEVMESLVASFMEPGMKR